MIPKSTRCCAKGYSRQQTPLTSRFMARRFVEVFAGAFVEGLSGVDHYDSRRLPILGGELLRA